MYHQVFLGVLTFYFVHGSSSAQYYVNDDGSSNQQFFYDYQPRSVQYYPNDLNRPVFYPQLGMSPQYHDLVYNYVKGFAGTEPPAHVSTFQPNYIYNNDHYGTQENGQTQNFGVVSEDSVATETEVKEQTTDKPGLNDYLLPSDVFSLNNHPNSQLYGNLNAIKMKKTNANAQPTSIPPVGGVVSNYVLLRTHSNPQNLLQNHGEIKENESNLQHIKRQIPDPDNSDGVVILAEPSQNAKMTEEEKPKEEETEGNKEEEEEQMSVQPGIAQSKPSAIALAGPGGVAQASPVGTALVGQGGLAVAAPSGTAVAGPAGQGALPVQIGHEKQKPTEKTDSESDSY